MKNWLLLGAVMLVSTQAAHAGVDKVYSPTVEAGEWEFETRGIIVDDDQHATDGFQKTKIELGHGITEYFSLGALFIFEKEKSKDYELEAYELEAKLELNEPGNSPVDLGLLLEVEKYREEDIWEIKGGPIFQKKFGSLTTRANLLTETKFGDDVADDGEVEVEGRFQAKYKITDLFIPAVEYYVDEDEQSAGPVITGELEAGQKEIEWQIGALFGLNSETPDTTYRWQLEFKF